MALNGKLRQHLSNCLNENCECHKVADSLDDLSLIREAMDNEFKREQKRYQMEDSASIMEMKSGMMD